MRSEKSSVLAVFTAIAVFGFSLLAAGPSYAAKTLWENGSSSLSLFGDMRLRLENDSDSAKDKDRTRERIRLRLGSDYKANENISMGFRLRSASENLQSPHQTLALDEGGGRNADFGIDRAFLKGQFGGFYLWGGKNALPIWNPAEVIWDDDLQPEGLAAGYNADLGGAKLGLSVGHFLLNENGWAEDDSVLAYQACIAFGESVKVKLAAGGLSFTDSEEGVEGKSAVIGQSHNITHVMGEIKAADMPFKPRVGVVYTLSDVSDKVIGAGAESSDKNTLVAYVGGEIGKVDVRFYYWDAGYAAMPALGHYAQDNFPFSSNFTGYHAQIGVKLLDSLSVDLRYYNQSTKNENITVWDSGVAMQGKNHDRSRIQMNLNLSF